MRRPLKTDSFRKILALGIPIETVLDIGIATGTPELMSVFKDKKHLLVEPVIEWNETINALYSKLGIDYTIVNVAASNTNGVMNMETSTVLPGLPISHARLTDKANGQNIRSVPIRTIDSLLQEYNMPAPYFLKIDVDGVEILILEGAQESLSKTNVVVVEANIKNFMERVNFLFLSGFEIFDIVDPCYYDDRLRSFDLLFLNSMMVKSLDLDMYRQPFDIRKWFNYS